MLKGKNKESKHKLTVRSPVLFCFLKKEKVLKYMQVDFWKINYTFIDLCLILCHIGVTHRADRKASWNAFS